MSQLTYNSVVWDTEYNFKIIRGGISGRFDLPAPRDDGFDWPADADTPVSIGMSEGMRDIIVVGRIKGSTHAAVLTNLVTFLNAMLLIRGAGEFQRLLFGDSATLYWSALPHTITTNFFGSDLNSKYVQITVIFKCHNDIGLVV